MAFIEVIELILVSLLTACLWRSRSRRTPKYIDATHSTAAAFDVTSITPRLCRLRRNYVAAWRSSFRAHSELRRNLLLASARQGMRLLSFFQRTEMEMPFCQNSRVHKKAI